MAKKLKQKAGSEFEEYVERQYRNLGAAKVDRNVNIGGHEIDVYVELPSLDGTTTRSIISCKDLGKPAGVEVVREWYQVFQPLRDKGLVDVAVIVSSKGFTQDAHAAARESNVKVLTRDALSWSGCNFNPYLTALLKEFNSDPVFRDGKYIPLTLSFEKSAVKKPAEALIQEFLEDENARLLTILGDYGAGKTTLTHKLFKDYAERFLSDSGRGRVPIFVNLKDYPNHLNFPSFLTDLLVNQYGARCPNFGVLRALSRDGKVLFIFDAFDEMATRSSQSVTVRNFEAMRSLFEENAKIILTCRTHYFKNKGEIKELHEGTELYKIAKGKSYSFAYVNPLTWDQIQEYVKVVAGAEWERDLEAIKKTYNLPALAEKPILLQMMTEVVPLLTQEGKRIDSTTLYAKYTDLWLKRDDWRVTLNREDRLRFTITLAQELYGSESDTLTWDAIAAAILRRWPREPKKDIEYYQYDIRTCTFIRRVDEDKYSFVHRSFMEYFVAARIYESVIEGDPQILRQKQHSREVLDFAAGHLCTEQVKQNITSLYRRAGMEPVLLANVLELARRWIIPVEGLTLESLERNQLDISELELRDITINRFVTAKLIGVGTTWSDSVISSSRIDHINVDKSRVERVTLQNSNVKTFEANGAQIVGMLVKGGRINSMRLRGTNILKGVFSESCRVLLTAQGGEIIDCDLGNAVLAGSKLTGTSIGGNWWGHQALDGVSFESVEFVDGGESLLRSVRRSKEIEWDVKPLFVEPKGLKDDIIVQLRAHGVAIR